MTTHKREVDLQYQSKKKKNFSFKARQTNLTRNQRYHVSNSHLHHTDTAAMPKRCQQGDEHRHTTEVSRPWPEEKRPRGWGAVGKLSLITRQELRHIAADTILHHLRASVPYLPTHTGLGSCLWLPFSTEPSSLFQDEAFMKVARSGKCV